jgi:hypothetical protein
LAPYKLLATEGFGPAKVVFIDGGVEDGEPRSGLIENADELRCEALGFVREEPPQEGHDE